MAGFGKCKYKLLELEKDTYREMIKDTEQYSRYIDTTKTIIKLNNNIEKLEKQQEEIKSSIENIKDDTIRKIFFLKYIEGKTWEQIANDVYYSTTHLMRLVRVACKSPTLANIKSIVE